jgi:hypothetical protein
MLFAGGINTMLTKGGIETESETLTSLHEIEEEGFCTRLIGGDY